MTVDIRTIACPQCGSTDVHLVSETQAICKSCGSKIAIQQKVETQNVYNIIQLQNDETQKCKEDICYKGEINPEFSHDQFLRKVWIQLAMEDAPLEVFSENFSEVIDERHQVIKDCSTFDVDYHASVGYDREEPYLDWEDYWEKEPYFETDSNGNLITKYKDVKRQRQVTKYKKVIDWSHFSGNCDVKCIAIAENIEKLHLDEDLFNDGLKSMKEGSFCNVTEENANEIEIIDSARKDLECTQRYWISYKVSHSLPGDHCKDEDWKIVNVLEHYSYLINTIEYKTCICFNGKTYIKNAFPFGNMKIAGDKIENNAGYGAVTGKMKADLNNRISEREKMVDIYVSNSTNAISILTIVLLLTSIIVSFFVRNTILVIAVFFVALLAFILNTVKVNREFQKENKLANDEIAKWTAKTKSEIAYWSKNYVAKKLETLNKKLKSLGYEVVADDDLKGE